MHLNARYVNFIVQRCSAAMQQDTNDERKDIVDNLETVSEVTGPHICAAMLENTLNLHRIVSNKCADRASLFSIAFYEVTCI